MEQTKGNTNWNYDVYEGVGPIKFGMSDVSVREIMGTPDHVQKNMEKGTHEFYGKCSIIYSKEGKVVEITFSPGIKVFYDGKNLFDHDTLDHLTKLDNQPYECLGFILFLKLGIFLSGFHDDDESQKAVGFFQKGHWDGIKKNFIAYKK